MDNTMPTNLIKKNEMDKFLKWHKLPKLNKENRSSE